MESKRSILIVDDLPMFRELGSVFLSRCGRVSTASSGHEALARAQDERPDVVLLDQGLPDLSGNIVCNVLRNDPELLHTSVIMLLPDEEPCHRADAFRAGAHEVIHKPLSRVTLIETVNRYLRAVPDRGQPRIPMMIPVRLRNRDKDFWGTGLNLSRGGIYVETDQSLPPMTELLLSFALPDTDENLSPTAQVVWRKVDPSTADRVGLGMRFLEIDRSTVQSLDEYIYERAVIENPPLGG